LIFSSYYLIPFDRWQHTLYELGAASLVTYTTET